MKYPKLWPMVMAVLLAVVPRALALPMGGDPPLLFIGTGSCGASCPKLFGSEVNAIGVNSLDLYYQSRGVAHDTLTDPILLILGIPNDVISGNAGPGITNVSVGSGQLGGSTIYSGTWNTSTGFAGLFTSGVVYDFIGLAPGGNNSERFTNWHDADLAINGIDATNFGIYVYSLTGQGLDPGETATVTFAASLPLGTFGVAYGCDRLNTAGTNCDRGGRTYSTPFTQSGLSTVPEPATLLLLGSGVVGAGIFRRRFHKRG